MFTFINPWAFIDPKDWPHIGIVHSAEDFKKMKNGKLIKRLLKFGLFFFSISAIVCLLLMMYRMWSWVGIPVSVLTGCAILCFVMLLEPPFGPKCNKYRKSIFRVVVYAIMILVSTNVCVAGVCMSSCENGYNIMNWLFILGITLLAISLILLIWEAAKND